MSSMVYMCMCIFAGIVAILASLMLPKLRKFDFRQIGSATRNRLLGGILAILAMAWVAPHIKVLYLTSFDPITFYAIIVIATALCIFYLDFLAARAFAGILIMFAYQYANTTFALIPSPSLLHIVTIAVNFILALFAIYVAARPYALRDFLVFLAAPNKAPLRLMGVGALFIYGILMILAGCVQ